MPIVRRENVLLVQRASERVRTQPPGRLAIKHATLATVRRQQRQRLLLHRRFVADIRRPKFTVVSRLLALVIDAADIAPEETFPAFKPSLVVDILLLETSAVKVFRILARERLVHLLLSQSLLRELRHATAADVRWCLAQISEAVLHPGLVEAGR